MSVNKKKILVVAQSYPTIDGNVGLMYIHTRNIKYIADGLNVTMLNFSAPELPHPAPVPGLFPK